MSDIPTIDRLDRAFMAHADKNGGRFPKEWPVDIGDLIAARKDLEFLKGRDGTPLFGSDRNGVHWFVGRDTPVDVPIDGLLVRGVRLTLKQ